MLEKVGTVITMYIKNISLKLKELGETKYKKNLIILLL